MTTVLAPGGPTLAQHRLLVTEIPGPRSRALLERRQAVVARGVGTMLPVFVERAGGGVLVDVDGNSLIDLGSGIAVIGGGQRRTPRRRRRPASRSSASPTPASWSPLRGLRRRCASSWPGCTPGDHDKRSALFNSGAEAVENAVKIARALHRARQAVVAFDHAYHGRTNLTMALTAKNMPYKQGFGPFAPEVYRMPMAYPYRWPTGPEQCGAEALAAVTGAIDAQVGAGNVAAW